MCMWWGFFGGDRRGGLDYTTETREGAAGQFLPATHLWRLNGIRGPEGVVVEAPLSTSFGPHVREMKACKWLPVIVPIKEQLR